MTTVDLLVIGGGITGAGIALEAARRGVGVMLVEAHDFAWGSSSRSSKLVHGGLRYLREGAFGLTRESVRERGRLLADAPGLVDPQRFLMGHYEGRSPSRHAMAAGLAIYDAMAGRRTRSFHASAQALELAPHLARAGLAGAWTYLDARTDDARLVMRVLQEAQRHGARVVCEVPWRRVRTGPACGAAPRERGQVARGMAQRIQRDHPEGGELATGDGEQPLLVAHHVLARRPGRIARLGAGAGDDGPHAGKRADRVRGRELQARERVAHGLDEVGRLRRRDGRFEFRILVMIEVGRADQRDALPRGREDGTAVARMHEAHRVAQRQAPEREDEVAAAQRPQHRAGAEARAQAIGPGAGGVDHAAGAHVAGEACPFDAGPDATAGTGGGQVFRPDPVFGGAGIRGQV